MAVKLFEIDKIGPVHVYKRRGSSSLRLSIAPDGKLRVTIPYWSTYAAGLDFVRSRSDWILANLPEQQSLLVHGQHVGKAHRLVFENAAGNSVRTRLAGSDIRIVKPIGMMNSHADAQQAAHRACIRALRVQAEKLLPKRLKQLAAKFGYDYSSVSVKQLKGRWGSCDTRQHITLNLFLMQLPWHLIDYVLLHELTHTKHLHHGADFWDEFLRHEPRAKVYRKQIKALKPVLTAEDPAAGRGQ